MKQVVKVMTALASLVKGADVPLVYPPPQEPGMYSSHSWFIHSTCKEKQISLVEFFSSSKSAIKVISFMNFISYRFYEFMNICMNLWIYEFYEFFMNFYEFEFMNLNLWIYEYEFMNEFMNQLSVSWI